MLSSMPAFGPWVVENGSYDGFKAEIYVKAVKIMIIHGLLQSGDLLETWILQKKL